MDGKSSIGKRYLSPAEVAAELSVSTSTVLRLIREQRLYALRISERIYRIPLPAFERFKSGATLPTIQVTQRRGTGKRIGADEPLPRKRRLPAAAS